MAITSKTQQVRMPKFNLGGINIKNIGLGLIESIPSYTHPNMSIDGIYLELLIVHCSNII